MYVEFLCRQLLEMLQVTSSQEKVQIGSNSIFFFEAIIEDMRQLGCFEDLTFDFSTEIERFALELPIQWEQLKEQFSYIEITSVEEAIEMIAKVDPDWAEQALKEKLITYSYYRSHLTKSRIENYLTQKGFLQGR
jgi:hypothetical protein